MRLRALDPTPTSIKRDRGATTSINLDDGLNPQDSNDDQLVSKSSSNDIGRAKQGRYDMRQCAKGVDTSSVSTTHQAPPEEPRMDQIQEGAT